MKDKQTHISILGDNVVVIAEKPSTKVGDLHLPETRNTRFYGIGVVQFVGSTCKGIHVGERLIIPNSIGKSSFRLHSNSEPEYLVFKQEDVIGKITEA